MRILLVEDEEYMAQAVAQVLKKTTIPLIWPTMENMAWTALFLGSMTSSFWISFCRDAAVWKS